ncbi:MAG: HAMP domain-containing histidine kinase [Oscillospiraceae bacterium]|nr:HAMP domain-containing histidine kinase [Oscillospiraceae bacterium]
MRKKIRTGNMHSSMFERMFLGNMALIIVSVIIPSAIYAVSMNNYVERERVSEISGAARHISHMIISGYADNGNAEVRGIYREFLKIYSSSLGAGITVTDGNGIIRYSVNAERIVPERVIRKTIRSSDIIIISKEEISEDYKTRRVIYSYPVIYENIIIGAVMFDCDVRLITVPGGDMFPLFVFAVAAVIIISVVMVYFQSKKLSRPIEILSRASKEISHGSFMHIECSETGEMGELIESFNVMSDSLRSLEEMRADFVSDVSHELRTPMTSISGFVQGMLDGTIPREAQEKYLNIVLSETHRLTRLINDMLDATNYTKGGYKYKMKNFNINELVKQTMFEFGNRAKENGMEFEEFFSEPEITVRADEDAIKRVFVNLFDNALKFGKEGTVITVDVKNSGGRVTAEVGNYGEGIGQDELNSIFSRFFKADKSRTDTGGTGLGLYLVNNIIKEHGGEITAESRDTGDGIKYTVFTFSLEKADA